MFSVFRRAARSLISRARALLGRIATKFGTTRRGGFVAPGAPAPPPALQPLTLTANTVAEGSAAGTVAAQILGATSGSVIAMTAGQDGGGRFTTAFIGGAWCVVTTATPTDYETATSHAIGLTETLAGATGSPKATAALTINVSNVFEVTLAALGGTFTLAEDAAAGAVAGALTGKSAGSALSLTNDAGGRVALSGTNVVRGATALDYETATSHSFTVRETHADGANSPRDTVLTLNVTDVAESAISAPVLTKTSGAGVSPMTFDETLDASAYAGYTRRIQRATDAGFTAIAQDLSKMILEGEVNGTDASWLATAENPPRNYATGVIEGLTLNFSGTCYFRERIERDDGTVSAWSNTISDTLVNYSALSSSNKHANVTVSGTPQVNFATASFDPSHQIVACDTVKTGGQRQWEYTVTANGGGSAQIGFGADDGTSNYNVASSPRPGKENSKGFWLAAWTTGFEVYQGTLTVASGYTGAADGFANGDVYSVLWDDAADTVNIYRTRSGVERLLAALTGVSQATLLPCAGADQSGVTGSVNFGQSAFTKALGGSWKGYGDA